MTKDKNDIRKKFREKRAKLTKKEVRQKSRDIQEKLLNNLELTDIETVFTYVSSNNEVSTKQFIRKMFREDVEVAVPRVKNEKMEAVKIRSLKDLNSEFMGISQPDESFPAINKKEIDIIVIPGVAFDLRGNRIGLGAGYYDSYLSDYNNMIIALAYSLQIVDTFKTDPWDVPVHMIVTNKKIIRTK